MKKMTAKQKKVAAAEAKLVIAAKKLDDARKARRNEIMKKDTGGLFFTFDQNNSGGSFVDNDRVCETVIIEAEDAEAANARALEIGLYFDGEGDCTCCGNRWYAQWSNDRGDKVPSIYGKPVETYDAQFYRNKAYVYYADGTKKVFNHKKKG